MKKIVSVIACLLFAATMLASCGAKPEKEAYELYKSAENKTNALRSYAAEVDLSVDVDYGTGTTYDLKSLSTMTADLDAKTTAQHFEYSGSERSMNSSVTVYHEKGTTYYTDGTNSYKYAEDDDQAIKGASSVASFKLPDAFTKAEIKKETDQTTVTCVVDGAQIKDLCSSYLAMIGQMTGVEPDFTFSPVNVTLNIDANGYLTGVKFAYTASFDFVGSDAVAVVESKIAYTDVSGGAVPVAPEGYRDFPDYDPNSATDSSSDDTMNEMSEEAIDAAIALFEADHQTRVANYDELYAQACAKYGKDTMDSIISIIEMFGSIPRSNG